MEKTKCKLRKRKLDGEMIVDNLRVLTDCFDPAKQNSSVKEIEDGHLIVWDEEAKVIDLTLDAEDIAEDICELKRKCGALDERLRSLVASALACG